MASASAGFLSPFRDSDLTTFCRVHGTGTRKEKESALEATERKGFLARSAVPGRRRDALSACFSDRTYGCPRGRRGRSGCPRGRRGRARRAGVAGEGRQRADVEGHEPAARRGGGRVGAEARLSDITRSENLHVGRIRSCCQFHHFHRATARTERRGIPPPSDQSHALVTTKTEPNFRCPTFFFNPLGCTKIEPKFATNSNSTEGRKTWWQPEQGAREPIGSDKIAGDLAGGGTHRAVRGGVPHGSGPAACPCGGSGF